MPFSCPENTPQKCKWLQCVRLVINKRRPSPDVVATPQRHPRASPSAETPKGPPRLSFRLRPRAGADQAHTLTRTNHRLTAQILLRKNNEVQFRRDDIKLYVAAKDLDTLKARFRHEMEQYLLLHPDCPRPLKSRYDPLPNYSFQPQPAAQSATSPSPQQEALQSVLFTDYVAQWLALKKQTVKPRTYQEYERMSKCHFQKDFAGVPLKDMTRNKIQEYLFRFVDEGKYRTAEKLHLAFSCIFDLAADDLGFVSPMKKIVLPYRVLHFPQRQCRIERFARHALLRLARERTQIHTRGRKLLNLHHEKTKTGQSGSRTQDPLLPDA